MVLFLSSGMLGKLAEELIAGGYAPAYAVFAVMLLYSLFMLQSTYRLAKV